MQTRSREDCDTCFPVPGIEHDGFDGTILTSDTKFYGIWLQEGFALPDVTLESYHFFLDAELNVDDNLEINVGNVIDVCVQTKLPFEKGAWLWGQRRPWSCWEHLICFMVEWNSLRCSCMGWIISWSEVYLPFGRPLLSCTGLWASLPNGLQHCERVVSSVTRCAILEASTNGSNVVRGHHQNELWTVCAVYETVELELAYVQWPWMQGKAQHSLNQWR